VNSISLKNWGFTDFSRAAQQEGILYDVPVIHSATSATISCQKQTYVNFAAINFLGLQQDSQILTHFLQAAQQYGLVTGGSRITQGICRAHQDVEEELCRLTGKERAITFASGLLANQGFIHAMSSSYYLSHGCRIDNRDAIFVLDHDCHWSIWKALEAFPYGKQRFAFRHNDPAHLEEVLAPLTGNKVVVLFESLYSSDGSIAPIGKILDVCERYHALSYVDDANGFLIYGPAHRPFSAEFAHIKRATFVMVSFAKAVGLEGGAIAGPLHPITAFELLSGTSIFTAAMQPPTASTAYLILQRLREQPELIDRYLERAMWFRQQLHEIGCVLNPTPSYITSISIGADEKVQHIRRAFREQGYIVPIFYYPAVKQNQAVIRLILHAFHTDDHVQGFLRVLSKLKAECRF
jgi:8-amino-7-oxononanoate synthase